MPEPMPEPEDGRYVVVGEPEWQVALVRDDEAAGVKAELGVSEGPWARWFDVTGDHEAPLTWGQVTWSTEDRGWLPEHVNRAVVEEMIPRSDVDLMVEKARQLAGIRHYGGHVIEPAGWCRHCSSHHAETEIARLAEQHGGGSDG